MLTFSEYSAWVSIEGAPAEEFGVEVSEEQNKVTCWIPSEEGKNFELVIKDNKLHEPTAASFYVDGHKCSRKPFYGKKLDTLRKNGIRTGAQAVRPFTFSRLKTTDEDSLSCSASPEIGEIRIEVHQASVRTLRSQPKGNFRDTPAQVMVNERSKKAVDHQTTFGQAINTRRTNFVDINTFGLPKAIFCFKYRPLGMLQANGIAPPPQRKNGEPSGQVKPDPDDVIEIHDDGESESEELERLRKRVRLLEGRQGERGSKRVKLEVKHEPVVGEVIDLSDL
ncbi:hypothetical protein V5O48_007809 [Marasmius crinis-equi]|uniref:DUF7918 domain-containing protein n=1 Tax=Marasmius crinis-equi TaxID=585013 RepID=A0ABR3FFS9_9AGAR